MADVFVSYKAEDRRRVKPLVDALEADGFSVWWDAHVSHGDEWRETIQSQLEHAKCVLVVWSKRSVGPDGQFVRDEASRGQRRHAYLPIRIDKVDPPLGFGETQAILFRGWAGNRSDQRYQSLLEAVRSVVSGNPSPTHFHVAPPVVSRRLAIGGSAAFAMVALAGGWFVFRPKPAEASNRIAVLPFANLSGDPSQAYFSDGIAEELRSSLSRIGMQVIGRASCEKVRNDDIKVAATKLDVANILTGSVRRSPSTIRIDAQLVSGEDGVEHWAQSYDRAPGDAIKIQTDIAENVAEALSITLGRAGKVALNVGGTSNPAAHDLFLKATRDIYTLRGKADWDRRIELFNAAILLDPNYADAYAYKAFLLALRAGDDRGLVDALAVVNRAIAIAPTMAHGYDVRGFIYWQLNQMRPALANARHAVALNSDDVNALGGYSNLLGAIGQYDEALKVSAKAIALDPLEPSRYRFRSHILFDARRYAEAADAARRAIDLQPDLEWNRTSLAYALLAQGKNSAAGAEFSKLDSASLDRVAGEALIAARMGQRPLAFDRLKALKGLNGDKGHSDYAEIYAQLGMRDDAFRELDLALQAHNLSLVDVRGDPFLDPLRSDPRYAALERKIAPS